MFHSWVELDAEQLRSNVRAVRAAVPEHVSVVFVVKANAYGHGLESVARIASNAGVNWFATAYLDEAIRLRDIVPEANLLVLGVIEPHDAVEAHARSIVPVIANPDHARALHDAAKRGGFTLDVHLKIDTGMGRLGVEWDDTPSIAPLFAHPSPLHLTGVCSHFSEASPEQPDGAREQVRRFNHALQFLPRGLFRHMSSSRAALHFPEWDYEGIRQGIVLYGYGADALEGRFHTRPVLQWKTRIMQVKPVPANYTVGYMSTHTTTRPTRIATLAVGYADGFNRALSNRGHVLIHGHRCPVIGRVSMNWITVDLGCEIPAQAGDEAVLIGCQGDEAIWASEISRRCRTIPYEILTSIRDSIDRRVINHDAQLRAAPHAEPPL